MPVTFHYYQTQAAQWAVADDPNRLPNPSQWSFRRTETVDAEPAPRSEAARALKAVERQGYFLLPRGSTPQFTESESAATPPQDRAPRR